MTKHIAMIWSGVIALLVVGVELTLIGLSRGSLLQAGGGTAILAAMALGATWLATNHLRHHRK